MTTDNSIFQELQGLSPVVAKIPRQLPYAVPADYFESFPSQVLRLIQQGSQAQSHTGNASSNPFPKNTGVNAGASAAKDPLAAEASQAEKFAQDAADELAELSPLLASLSKKSPFSLPEGYFDQVPGEINAGISGLIQANDILEEALTPMLESARHRNPYSVPQGYFEQFPSSLLNKINRPATGGGTIINMGARWVKYAAAAVVTGVIALSTWLYYNPSPGSATNGLAAQLQQEMDNISDEAILEFTNPTTSVYYGTAANGAIDLTNEDLHYMLGDVSDEALQQYLAEQSGKSGSLNN